MFFVTIDTKGRPIPASPENISKTKTPSHTPSSEIAVLDRGASGEDIGEGASLKDTKHDLFAVVPVAEVQSGDLK